MFEQKGIIVIEGGSAEEETVLEISLENGADDVRSEGEVFEVVSNRTSSPAVDDGPGADCCAFLGELCQPLA